MDIFLNNSNSHVLTLCREILEGLVNYINISRNVFEYLYQQIAEFFRKEMDLTDKLINKYIDLLKILYGEKLIEFKPTQYFYLNGNGGIKVNEKSLEEEKIKLNNVILYLYRELLLHSGSELKAFLQKKPLIYVT
jgi:hypothetical protein